MIKFFTNPYFYIPAIIVIVIILMIVGKKKWGWFSGMPNEKLSERKIVLPNTKTIIKNSQTASLSERRTATASNVVMPVDECKQLSAETKYLSEQLKSLYDALTHEEAGNIDVILKFWQIFDAYYDRYIKCVSGEVCKNKSVTCYGY